MAKLVRLKHQTGQFWDSRVGWGIRLDEVKELPEDIPAGSLLAERLRMGAFIEVDTPQEKLAFEAPVTATEEAGSAALPIINEPKQRMSGTEAAPTEAQTKLKSVKPKTIKRRKAASKA